jgi:A/G-specific adenine glycosylase
MLQQTQVDRVIPRFEAFIGTWPTVGDLASAPLVEVLALWSGLGYNSRAVRLHEAASRIDRDGWPTSVEGLRELPGVGPYTAAAIASIAFGLPVPAVDTNLRRILSRWQGEALSGVALASAAQVAVGTPAGDWNQAMMDLGATICRPTSPRCSDCPVHQWCADPTVYEPPPRQSRFEGSNRQLRGAIVRAHLEGVDPVTAGAAIGRTPVDVLEVVETLRDEGLLPSEPGVQVESHDR